ncbi:transcriptional regulator, TetR family [Aeromicrobium marinum DSM 15272]|uniref:Transcriptional regulator, TetR family n=1 Tax=Aeromicrobium marinum DSM 15272 TaxID=585531 RepID=E2SBP3_9ACTN|nr:TetR/AcrR family transcriptional regulator [Aeromicrobium marinum]EFQ83789.1 transcriptional regulator, TetR family [Aeromicrobium marinum DSM 15272]
MPKILGGSLEEHRLTTRRRVFEALGTLMVDRSFDAITMADLASAAGIGRTAIYNHFRDKEAVVVAFATDETSRYLDRLEAALAGARTPADRLSTYVRHHVETSAQFHFGLGPELYGMLSQSALLEIRDHVVAVETVLRDILAAGRSDGSFVDEEPAALVALVHACLQPRQVPADAAAAFVVRAVSA